MGGSQERWSSPRRADGCKGKVAQGLSESSVKWVARANLVMDAMVSGVVEQLQSNSKHNGQVR